MHKIFLFIVSLLMPMAANAWGQKGHDVVAYIAEQNLSKGARKRVTALLEGHSMVYVANWMDNASHTPEYEHTKTWHYVNVDPSEKTYANSVKEANGDVVVAINGIIERINSGELSGEQERVELIRRVTKDMPNVEVDCSAELLADYARRKGDCVIVKGLRAGSDFENEFQMALINRKINPDLDTMFLTAEHQYMYMSSSTVKELGHYGVELSDFLPEEIIPDFLERIKK